MTEPLADAPPPLVAQDMPPSGSWQPVAGDTLVWTPVDGYEGPAVGPVLAQEHDSGTWLPGPGCVMAWTPNDPSGSET